MFRFTLTYQSSSVVAIDPVGWQDMDVKYIRSEKFWGLFYEVTGELGFFCDSGGDLLKTAFEAEGSEADVLVLVEFQCSDGDPYDTIMNGRAKMDKYRVERLEDADIMYVNIENNDLNYKILSREDTPLDLKSLVGMDGQALANYPLNSVDLFRKLRLISKFTKDITNYTGQGTINITFRNYIGLYIPQTATTQTDLAIAKDTAANEYLFAIVGNSTADWWYGYGHLFNEIQSFETTDVQKWPSDVTIDYDVSGTIVDNNTSLTRTAQFIFRIYVYDSLGAAGAQAIPEVALLIGSFASSIVTETFNYSFTGSVTIPNVPEGYKVWPCIVVQNYLTTSVASGGSPVNIQFTTDKWDFTITCDNEYPETPADTLLIHEAFSRTLESISGQIFAFKSDLLGRKNSQPITYPNNGCHSFMSVTNGFAIRGKTEPIETSLSEMYDSLDSVANIGLGIETAVHPLLGSTIVARLEEKDYFFDNNTLILTLNGVESVDSRVWEEEIFNENEIGFEEWQPFSVTGLDEPLTVHSYQNRIKNIKNKLDLKSPAIMAMNIIEIVRRFGAENKLTQDLSQDEKLFYIALNRSVDASGNPDDLTTPEKDENFISTSNITNPDTSYNLRYSPARNLLRHMNRLAISLLKFPGSLWRFASGEGNVLMSNVQAADGCAGDYQADGLSTPLTENQNTAWDDSAIRKNTPIFEPVIYSFRYALSYSEFKLIRATPRGYIRVTTGNGSVLEGFVKEISYTLEKGIADFELIKKY